MQKKRLHSREYAVNNFLVLSFSFLYLHTAVNISFNFLLIWEPLCGSLTIVTSATQKCLAHKISLTIWVKSMLCTHLNSEHIGGTLHSCHTALVILESMFFLDGIDMSLLCLYIFWNYTCAIKKESCGCYFLQQNIVADRGGTIEQVGVVKKNSETSEAFVLLLHFYSPKM